MVLVMRIKGTKANSIVPASGMVMISNIEKTMIVGYMKIGISPQSE